MHVRPPPFWGAPRTVLKRALPPPPPPAFRGREATVRREDALTKVWFATELFMACRWSRRLPWRILLTVSRVRTDNMEKLVHHFAACNDKSQDLLSSLSEAGDATMHEQVWMSIDDAHLASSSTSVHTSLPEAPHIKEYPSTAMASRLNSCVWLVSACMVLSFSWAWLSSPKVNVVVDMHFYADTVTGVALSWCAIFMPRVLLAACIGVTRRYWAVLKESHAQWWGLNWTNTSALLYWQFSDTFPLFSSLLFFYKRHAKTECPHARNFSILNTRALLYWQISNAFPFFFFLRKPSYHRMHACNILFYF